MSKKPLSTLIVGVDVQTKKEALKLFDVLENAGVRWIKIGPVLVLVMGIPQISLELHNRGINWFLDAKFANTDSILKQTVSTALSQGEFSMVNCMADSGPEALKQFADACRFKGSMSLAVSFLTTKDDKMCMAQHGRTSQDQVLFYANEWIAPAGIDGMVCSARETKALRDSGYAGILVCPGIRFKGTKLGDQRRVKEPADAIKEGADYLVMASDILADPVERIKRYVDEVGAVL